MTPFDSRYSAGVSYTAIPVTPDATVDIAGGPVRMIDVVAGGDIAFIDARGSTVTLTGLPDGYQIKCVVRRILVAGTTALGPFIGYP